MRKKSSRFQALCDVVIDARTIIQRLVYVTDSEFAEEEHPRGQPDNPGKFVAKGGENGSSVATGKKAYSKPSIQESPGKWLVESELKDVPEHHLDGLQSISFQEQDLIQANTDRGIVEALGVYYSSKRTITLSLNARSTKNPAGQNFNVAVFGGKTVIHEAGHHVHLSRLTDAAAREWEELSGNGEDARISAYARTNRGEHFAEAYRAYFGTSDINKSRAKLKALEPRAYKFMAGLAKDNGKKLLAAGQMAAEADVWRRYDANH